MSKQDFEYFRELDAFLLEQEVINADQKLWLEHDAINDIGNIAMLDVTTDLV